MMSEGAGLDKWSYSFISKKSSHMKYHYEVLIFDKSSDMRDCYGEGKISNSVEGIFYPARGNGRYVGKIMLANDLLSIETIIHESMHCGFESMRHIGRRIPDKYEESVVSVSAEIAANLIQDLIDDGKIKIVRRD